MYKIFNRLKLIKKYIIYNYLNKFYRIKYILYIVKGKYSLKTVILFMV